jgi:phospholipase/carboxylesterase
MHGRGVDETDLLPLFDVVDPHRRLLGIAPGGPITDLPPGGRHWYVIQQVGFPEPTSFHSTLAELAGFLDQALADHAVPWDRTVLGGFSQGTVMAYALGLSGDRPAPAGILAMSGFVPTVEGWVPDTEARRGLPVWISHGTLDPVIPVELARQSRRLLEDGGLDVTYHEYEMGHTIDPRLLPQIEAWVRERVPDPAPSA